MVHCGPPQPTLTLGGKSAARTLPPYTIEMSALRTLFPSLVGSLLRPCGTTAFLCWDQWDRAVVVTPRHSFHPSWARYTVQSKRQPFFGISSVRRLPLKDPSWLA